MDWTDDHRYFMQYIISYRLIEKTELQTVHTKIFGEEVDMKNTLALIDNKIPKLGLRLLLKNCETSGLPYFILIPLWYNNNVINLNNYTEIQLNMFKSILHKILEEEDGQISLSHCLNLRDDKMSLKEANDFLSNLISNKYFLLINNDFIRLSILLIYELEFYIKKYFNEIIKICNLCKNEVYYNIKCNCFNYYHEYCLQKYRNVIKQNDKCPACL